MKVELKIHHELQRKYKELLEFTIWASKQSCCNVCDCRPCEAISVLRKIGETND